MRRLLRTFTLVLHILSLGAMVMAAETTASDSSTLVLTHRDLQQFELTDVIFVCTLDGTLQARMRDSGTVLWTLQTAELIDVKETSRKSSPTHASGDSKITWLPEPSELGGLYYFTPEGGIERIPTTVLDLVQKAPFGIIENIVYTGSRKSTLYAIDFKTGEIVQAYGETLELPHEREQVDPSDVVMIGRTEYVLDIHEHAGPSSWRIRIAMWTPNGRDNDLAAQYTSSMDSTYVTPISDHAIMALAENDMRPQRWVGETSSTLVSVFDILRSKQDGYLASVPQPPLKLSGMAKEWDLYVAQTPSDVSAVLSGPRYAALLGSAPLSKFCSGTGPSILGVHPLWCQDKRKAQDNTLPAISLLPPPSLPTSPGYPRLDPPVSELEHNRVYSFFANAPRWIHITGLVLLVVFMVLFSQGLVLRKLNPYPFLPARLAQESSVGQKAEEPKKRKRGARGGRRNNGSTKSKVKEQEDEKGSTATAGTSNSAPSSTFSPPITISDTVLGYGSHGTTVFKGRFENRDVAVKRMLLDFYDVASQEVDILRESDDHPNVVRYYCKYETEQFLYIALELCPGTLEDLVRDSTRFDVAYEPLDALRQVTMGLQHLHSLQIVHRDIKPQNILVALPTGKYKNSSTKYQTLGVRYLISDFGLCRKLEGEQSSFLPTFADSVAGTAGWAAPEIINQNSEDKTRLTRAVDIFSMGCLFYYVLSDGQHPFGDVHMRQVNIQHKRPPVLEPGKGLTPEALDIITRMLDFDPASRPSTSVVLRHPVFWSDQQKLDFLVRVSDRLEHESREEKSPMIDRLEVHAKAVVGSDWHTAFPQRYVDDLGKYRRYHGDRILDLLRAIRNKLHHYNDFSEELKECVGKLPSEYLAFYTSRFPKLLMTVYYYAESEFESEEAFNGFF